MQCGGAMAAWVADTERSAVALLVPDHGPPPRQHHPHLANLQPANLQPANSQPVRNPFHNSFAIVSVAFSPEPVRRTTSGPAGRIGVRSI